MTALADTKPSYGGAVAIQADAAGEQNRQVVIFLLKSIFGLAKGKVADVSRLACGCR
jgi:hypothetical protein